jgi:uncharacterized membrane protein YgdD (TMEM256/DUF423 family)
MKSDSISLAFPYRVLAMVGVLGALGVGLGAFGAHGLETLLADWGRSPDVIPKRLSQFDVGVRYHLVHVVAILAMSALPLAASKLRSIIVGLFVSGIVFFSGSLYVLVLAEKPILGAVTPIGGACLIAAWSLLVVLAMKNKNRPT